MMTVTRKREGGVEPNLGEKKGGAKPLKKKPSTVAGWDLWGVCGGEIPGGLNLQDWFLDTSGIGFRV